MVIEFDKKNIQYLVLTYSAFISTKSQTEQSLNNFSCKKVDIFCCLMCIHVAYIYNDA